MKNKPAHKTDRDLSFDLPSSAAGRFKPFCANVLGVNVDDAPCEQGIFMKQCLSIVFYATILFLLTNGIYLVKNIAFNTMIVIDMVPLYMMVASSLAMLLFIIFYKNYDSNPARYVLLAFYIMVIASVTVFMVSCNYHKIGLSISMCYLFVIMAAPTYKLSDTVLLCVLIAVGWFLPAILHYSDNYNLFKHFLLRFAIVAGFISVRLVFINRAADERRIKEISNAYVSLAFNDTMTGTLNKKALEAYRSYIVEKLSPEKVSLIIYDIDDFKSYNDHYSHVQGDRTLKLISERAIGVLNSPEQYLFRFGGEEFVALLPNVSESEATLIAVEMLKAIRSAEIFRNDLPGQSIVTASFGVAEGTKEELSDLSLFVKADKQLYAAKNGGKNSVAANNVIHN